MDDEGFELLKAIMEGRISEAPQGGAHVMICDCAPYLRGHREDCLWTRIESYLREKGIKTMWDK